MKNIIDKYLLKSSLHLAQFQKDDKQSIIKAAKLIIKAFNSKKKLLICGNGGSASDAQHLSAELIGRFKKDRQSFPAISLNTDTSALTAISNDYTYSKVFSRQVEGLGNKGDVLFLISTSGKSKNVIEAAKVAKVKKIKTISLTGISKSTLSNICDINIHTPADETCYIQELHIKVIHLLCVLIEEYFRVFLKK